MVEHHDHVVFSDGQCQVRAVDAILQARQQTEGKVSKEALYVESALLSVCGSSKKPDPEEAKKEVIRRYETDYAMVASALGVGKNSPAVVEATQILRKVYTQRMLTRLGIEEKETKLVNPTPKLGETFAMPFLSLYQGCELVEEVVLQNKVKLAVRIEGFKTDPEGKPVFDTVKTYFPCGELLPNELAIVIKAHSINAGKDDTVTEVEM